jgi:hypothetical protein
MIATQTEAVCHICGIPADASYFDDSSIADAPAKSGAEVVLAKFDLHASYCGELQYFAQYTDAYAKSPVEVETPNLEWQIRVDGQPLAPWLTFSRIINPWGLTGFPIHIRLREGGLLEFVVRFTGGSIIGFSPSTIPVTRVGGRLLGRFWYNPAFGGY